MASPRKPPPPVKPGRPDAATVANPVISELSQDGTVSFAGTPDASYERRLVFDHVVPPKQATRRERFEAVAWAIRDLLSQRWIKTGRRTTGSTPSRSTTCRWSSSSAGRSPTTS